MMTRKELASALEMLPVNDPDWRWDLPLTDIVAAARMQLALMPEKCDHFWCRTHELPVRIRDRISDLDHGNGRDCSIYQVDPPEDCPTCHGSGKVYSAELVERIATALLARWESATTYGGVADYREDAVAVLDALGETE